MNCELFPTVVVGYLLQNETPGTPEIKTRWIGKTTDCLGLLRWMSFNLSGLDPRNLQCRRGNGRGIRLVRTGGEAHSRARSSLFPGRTSCTPPATRPWHLERQRRSSIIRQETPAAADLREVENSKASSPFPVNLSASVAPATAALAASALVKCYDRKQNESHLWRSLQCPSKSLVTRNAG